MEIIPTGDREFGPLLLAIQADRTANSMDSAEVLQQINECISDKALLKPAVKAKLTGEKRARDNTGGKWCSHHNSSSHNDEECRKLAELAANNQPANKKLKTSKGAKAEAKPAKGKKAATKATGKTPTKASKTEQGLADQVKALEAKLETLVQSATNSKKIQVLKTKVGKYIHYLNHYTDNELLNENPIYLDSGASKHVAPVELALDNVTEVTTPHFLIDATNNQSPIQMQGDLTHNTGDDRIILTSSHAYYQAAGDASIHEIARVVSGMYCMAPLRKIHETAKVSACQLITKSMPPTLTIQRQPTPGVKRYIKPRLLVSQDEVAEAEVNITRVLSGKITKIPHLSKSDDDYQFLKRIHNKFGHFSFKTILSSIKDNKTAVKDKDLSHFVKILDKFSTIPKTIEECPECAVGKIAQKPITSTSSPATKVLAWAKKCLNLFGRTFQRHWGFTAIVYNYTATKEAFAKQYLSMKAVNQLLGIKKQIISGLRAFIGLDELRSAHLHVAFGIQRCLGTTNDDLLYYPGQSYYAAYLQFLNTASPILVHAAKLYEDLNQNHCESNEKDYQLEESDEDRILREYLLQDPSAEDLPFYNNNVDDQEDPMTLQVGIAKLRILFKIKSYFDPVFDGKFLNKANETTQAELDNAVQDVINNALVSEESAAITAAVDAHATDLNNSSEEQVQSDKDGATLLVSNLNDAIPANVKDIFGAMFKYALIEDSNEDKGKWLDSSDEEMDEKLKPAKKTKSLDIVLDMTGIGTPSSANKKPIPSGKLPQVQISTGNSLTNNIVHQKNFKQQIQDAVYDPSAPESKVLE
ncbi:hypothetical protein HDU78_010017 [Chytriomyces hyalinus]|nr:hypothetical protein HDU78_010017 [Chytriomyces hyalinus]